MSRHRPKYSKMFYLLSQDTSKLDKDDFWTLICGQCKKCSPELCKAGDECIKQIKIYYQNKAEGGK